MATLFVHHKVADYEKWRAVFDSLHTLRQSYGETTFRVLSASGNVNEVMVLSEFTAASQARKWATSSDLKEGMQDAGVLTQPYVLIMEVPTDAQALAAQLFASIEAQDFETAHFLLSEDFEFSGVTEVPLSADQWLNEHRALAQALPDLCFNYTPTSGACGKAEGTVQISGTHTGVFVAPLLELPPIAATGEKILNPKEHIWITAQDGKLTELIIEDVPLGGLIGILSQMGSK